MKREHVLEVIGLFFIGLTVLIVLSFLTYSSRDLSFYTSAPQNPPANLIHVFGARLSGMFFFVFGWASYVFPFSLALLGRKLVKAEPVKPNLLKVFGILILSVASASFFATFLTQESTQRFSRGGIVGLVFSDFLIHYFGQTGTYVLLIMLGLLSLPLIGEILIFPSLSGAISFIAQRIQFRAPWGGFFSRNQSPAKKKVKDRSVLLNSKVFPSLDKATRQFEHEAIEIEEESSAVTETAGLPAGSKPSIRIAKPNDVASAKSGCGPGVVSAPADEDYIVPSLDLLELPPPVSVKQLKGDLTESAKILEDTLNDFGISVRVADIERGPVITRYELEPAPGVKIQNIVNRSQDIALTMKAPSIRIVAPIPGKNRVGVEVPNLQSAMVFLREVLAGDEFRSTKARLPLAIGKDTAGKSVIADLADMPHLLIAGTTGSGKTVCVNGIILSLLFNFSPNDLKFLMVDPKMVELAPYNGLPHLLTPVVTDHKKVASALAWVTQEMDGRYQLLAKEGARNIVAYNQRKQKLPYIVVIIDELADLMMIARDQIESAIARLAQLSRAVGIHLVLATQRPSVDVITGVIKANFPARISFKVASKVDSRTVLDMNGAEELIGRGDMLFLQPGQPKPLRAQSSYLKDVEIERVLQFIKKQAQPLYDETIMKHQDKAVTSGTQERDELYDTAARVVIETGQASVCILQRRLRLGYTRAARLIDMMQEEGIVGEYRGSKPREILVDRKKWLEEQIQRERTDHHDVSE